MNNTEKSLNINGLLNLMVVYFVWGSTYLAIRVAVQADGGFPPFILGFSRVAAGSCILLLWSVFRRERVKPSREELKTLIFSGLLLWVGGNGLVNWAEQRTDSGLVALLIAATPIWIAFVEAVIEKRLPSWRLVLALMIGFSGIALLTIPTLRGGISSDIFSMIAVLLAGLSWGAGSVLVSRRPVELSIGVSAGYQQLTGAVGFLVVILLLGEKWSPPSSQAWLAWGYLVIFGSIWAFTSFIRAVKLLPIKIVSTYAYVNPVIAVFLGWLILGEAVTAWMIGGASLVLLGVAGVFRERAHL